MQLLIGFSSRSWESTKVFVLTKRLGINPLFGVFDFICPSSQSREVPPPMHPLVATNGEAALSTLNLLSLEENFPEGSARVLNYKSRPRNQCQFHTPSHGCSSLRSATAHIMHRAFPCYPLQAFALQCGKFQDRQKPRAVRTDGNQRFYCMRMIEHY